MKKILAQLFLILVLVLAATAVGLYSFKQVNKYHAFQRVKTIRVLLVYDSSTGSYGRSILSAYETVLQERGIPFEAMSYDKLATYDPSSLSTNIPAIIFPDYAAQNLPEDMALWTKNYLKHGGNIAVVYNAGTKHSKAPVKYLKSGLFSNIIGLNYVLFREHGDARPFVEARLKFKNPSSAAFLQVPEGNTMDGFLSGYQYGPLTFPMAVTSGLPINNKYVYAYGVTKDHKTFPAIVLKPYGKGHVLYVDLPLGYLSAYASDGLLLKSLLRMFLFNVVKIPHLMYTPYGKGGMVINWHIENYLVRKSVPYMIKNGILRKNLKMSLDVSAGNWENVRGDGRGVDACGKNRPLIKQLMDYGTIGTDGGMAHNWWYRHIQSGQFKEPQMTRYIRENNECLQSITGYRIREYMPSQGVFPQPVSTQILDKLGMIATYYDGNVGSGPTLMFWKGKLLSNNVIAFPVTVYGDVSSLYEFRKSNISNAEAFKWQKNLVDYCVNNRVIRLWYSHPYDIWSYNYLKDMTDFTGYLEKRQNEGSLIVEPMLYFAKFIRRLQKTTYDFTSIMGGGLTLSIQNKEGLKAITVALPKTMVARPKQSDTYTLVDGANYYYLTFIGDRDAAVLHFEGVASGTVH
ncbi:MAG TPA: hypothetical protein VMV40_01660 [Acidiferrobacter sp.]|nr:hypothetical protein [Acidiferrobacter sp.]